MNISFQLETSRDQDDLTRIMTTANQAKRSSEFLNQQQEHLTPKTLASLVETSDFFSVNTHVNHDKLWYL